MQLDNTDAASISKAIFIQHWQPLLWLEMFLSFCSNPGSTTQNNVIVGDIILILLYLLLASRYVPEIRNLFEFLETLSRFLGESAKRKFN